MAGAMHLALISVRMVPLFAIACAAPLAAAGEEVLAPLRFWHLVRAAESNGKNARLRWATTAVWVLGLAAVATIGVAPVRLGEGSTIPVAAIRGLPRGRVFTTDQWADYLIYAQPGRKVFSDGRNDFYGPAFVQTYLTILKAEPGWQQTFKRYGVAVALVPTASPLSAALHCAPGWRKVDRDGDAVVLARQGDTNREHDAGDEQNIRN